MNKIVCINIKTLRQSRRETQIEFSKGFNITRGMLDSYERFVASPSPDLVKLICKHYNVSFEDIYNIDFTITPPGPFAGADHTSIKGILRAKDEVINTQKEMIEILKKQINALTVKK